MHVYFIKGVRKPERGRERGTELELSMRLPQWETAPSPLFHTLIQHQEMAFYQVCMVATVRLQWCSDSHQFNTPPHHYGTLHIIRGQFGWGDQLSQRANYREATVPLAPGSIVQKHLMMAERGSNRSDWSLVTALQLCLLWLLINWLDVEWLFMGWLEWLWL